MKEGEFLYQEAHKIVELFEYTWLDTRNQEGPGVFRRESCCLGDPISFLMPLQKLVKEGKFLDQEADKIVELLEYT